MAKDEVQIKINPAVVLAVAETTIAEMEARQAAGENVAGPLAWHRGLAERMSERIAKEAVPSGRTGGADHAP